MATFPIIVYGDGKLFREYFNAIVAFFGTSNFSSLLNIALLLATVTVCYSYITKRSLMVLIKWFGLFYISVYVLFTPRTTVTIVDRVNGSMQYIVDHVPLGLAIIASYTSAIDDALTQSIESNFTMPDYMPYRQTGMVFASRLMMMANQFEISDATFDGNLQEFVHQCVFYDILLNKYSINDLLDASNVWSFVTSNASPARAFIYNGTVTTCREGAKNLSNDWKTVLDSSIQDYSQRIYPNLTKEKAKTQFLLDLPISYRYLTDVSAQAQDIMQQNLMSNAIQRGVVGMGAKLDATAALESYTFARAQEQKRLTNTTTGEMAANWLAKFKIAVEAIVYGSFIFIVLLSVFPFGGMVLRNYCLSLLWIHLWAPMYAIINLMISYDAQSHSTAAANGVLSLKSMSGLLQINSDIAGLAGNLSMAVPFLVSGIIWGMHRSLGQGAQFDNGVSQSAISAGVNEAVTGNMSFGNTSFGNRHANNNTANHVDTSGRMSAGMTTSQLTGGSLFSTSADGSHIMDMRGSMSNLGAAINLTDGLRSSYSQQVERAESASLSDNIAHGQASNAAIRDMYDISHHLGKSSSSGDSWSVSNNASAAQAISENDRLTQEYADRHHLSYHDAANALTSAYIDGKASASFGVGGKVSPFSGQVGIGGGVSRSAAHNSGTDKGSSFSDAQSYIHDTNYSKNVDLVSRAAKDHSLRFNNEEANRLVNSMGASFDKAESARHDMQSHYQEAQSARENAARVEEHAASIQVNGTQEYNQWLENQPGTNGHGKMGSRSIEAINKDPHLSQYYANQFIEQYKSKLESNWNHGLEISKEGIHRQYETNNQKVPSMSSIHSSHNSNVNSLEKQANQEGLHSQNFIDTSAKQQTDKLLSSNQNQISNKADDLSQRGTSQKEAVTNQESRHRHAGLTHDLLHGINTNND
ncbi:MAG: conjugal transfer protein TraG N-terminal domain-containing protein [Gammaproteobacteria bacterium]